MDAVFTKSCRWCWHPDMRPHTPGFLLVRREFVVTEVGARLHLHVSADHRYNLYLDGRLIGRGPCRSDTAHYRYETYDEPLAVGAHVLAARVVVFPAHGDGGETWGIIAEMHRSGGWLAAGGVHAGGQLAASLETPGDWRCRHDPARTHRPIMADPTAQHTVVAPMEVFDAALDLPDWAAPTCAPEGWVTMQPLWAPARRPIARDPSGCLWLEPRDIPFLRHAPQPIARVAHVRGLAETASIARRFASPDAGTGYGPIVIPAGATASITLDVGHLTTAFPQMRVEGAAGGMIRLRYSESLFTDDHKRDRAAGDVKGSSDVVHAGPRPTEFEPFWFRTFRFLELHVEAPAAAPVVIHRLALQSWMYPFDLRGAFDAGDASLARVWDVAWRTATLCAHEHYEDCPYFEQLQYVGDTRIQALISYYATGDGRLARQALRQFDWSRLPEGLTQSRYPSNWMQVIPSFSMFWVLMLHDYVTCQGDDALVQELLPGVRTVLDWFERRRLPNGLVGPLEYWGFHDWVEGWPHGAPHRDTKSPVTLDSLMYAETCRVAAGLCTIAGAHDAEARMLQDRHASLVAAVRATCFDAARGLFVDLPGLPHVSQHTNAWAILADAVTGADAQSLGRALAERTELSPATLYYAFYLFRAWEKAGCYDLFWGQLERWKSVLKWNFTTFPEIPSPDTRSDCHAWSASPIYEFLACVLGVQPGAPGFRALTLRPHPGPLAHASGRACAGDQIVKVRWEVLPQRRLHLEFALERPIPVTIHWPDGTRQDLGVQQRGTVEGGL
ncbi:MAG: family 78 glycoside hydrolase catalytic domain [Lentisphaerae bacterium]|nr:family 78 glycoside hydrolase catalytic domain [Lentisphaerota bacterium]